MGWELDLGINLFDPQFLLYNAAINPFGVHEPQVRNRGSTKGSGVGLPFSSAPLGEGSTCWGEWPVWEGLQLTALLGQWPGLAWPGRFVFLINGASQPHALPFLSCPDCPVPRARVTPGEAQGQHT